MKVFLVVTIGVLNYFNLAAQTSSINSIEQILTNGSTKSWYTHPVIIDNPQQIPYSVITFNINGKKGNFYRHSRGRDIGSRNRDFKYSIQLLNEDFFLIISQREKYKIIIGERNNILKLEGIEDNSTARRNLAGTYNEEKFDLNR